MNNDEIRRTISQINNDLYYQKLGPIISQLRNWLTEKDRLIQIYIMESGKKLLQNSNNTQQQIEMFCLNFSQLVSQIIDTFSKIVPQPLSLKRISSLSSKKINIENKTPHFKKSKMLWFNRKEKLCKISQSGQIIFEQLKYDLQQNNKAFQQFKNMAKKLKPNTQWSDAEYMKKFTITSVKNNHKQYQINKIKLAAEMFNQQIKQYNQIYCKFCEAHQNLLKCQQNLIQRIYANVVGLCSIMGQCLVTFDHDMVDQSNEFAKKIKDYALASRNWKKQIQTIQTKSITELKVKLQLINSKAFDQILITSWDIKYKSSIEDQFIYKKGILTFDDKFYIVQKSNKFMFAQVNLSQAVINDTENLGQIVLKGKKKSRHFPELVIKFQKVENQDEFKLHLKKAQGLIS